VGVAASVGMLKSHFSVARQSTVISAVKKVKLEKEYYVYEDVMSDEDESEQGPTVYVV